MQKNKTVLPMSVLSMRKSRVKIVRLTSEWAEFDDASWCPPFSVDFPKVQRVAINANRHHNSIVAHITADTNW